jgi:hypothetical protein
MRCYVESRSDLPRSGLGAIERSEHASFSVADGAVSEADGAGGGQYARKFARAKSRHGRDGASRGEKAVALQRDGVVQVVTR